MTIAPWCRNRYNGNTILVIPTYAVTIFYERIFLFYESKKCASERKGPDVAGMRKR